MNTQDFLLEIGCEELPPLSLTTLEQSFAKAVLHQLNEAQFSPTEFQTFVTPRRLAILIKDLDTQQPMRIIERQGPNVNAAYDKNGMPTLACLGFANSCGVSTDQLKTKETPKGKFVYCLIERPGESALQILPHVIQTALKQLALEKHMRWGASDTSFIRPVRWTVMLLGKDLVHTTLLGQNTTRETRGHRFHHPKNLTITQPKDYQQLLMSCGMVIADFSQRREKIKQQITKTASPIGIPVINERLLNEVTGMVEWPVALLGKFSDRFLKLPPEVLITVMNVHQRYFPIKNDAGKMLPYFITISNIQSKDPKQIIAGNERVLNARLSDALFFYESDLSTPLFKRFDALKEVTFQHALGTMAEKSSRIAKLTSHMAILLNVNAQEELAKKAGLLSLCDRVTKMVYEFPTLQGIMGAYYALHDKEPLKVAEALKEHYLPAFSGDTLPDSPLGCCLSLADRIDTLIGIIGIGKLPTGDKDPFGLRRSALGLLRILIEKELTLDLFSLLNVAKKNYRVNFANKDVVIQTFNFILERLKSWYLEKGMTPEVFAAVHAKQPHSPLDFDRRIKAVQHFLTLPEAASLAAGNKRVSNILKKQAKGFKSKPIVKELLELPSEIELAEWVDRYTQKVEGWVSKGQYNQALSELAALKKPIDRFFDEVMVMVDDKAIRDNRLSLLSALHHLFTQVADISIL